MFDHAWVHALPPAEPPVFPPRIDERARDVLSALWSDKLDDYGSWSPDQRRLVALRIHASACANGGPPNFGPARALDALIDGLRWSRDDLIWTLRELSGEWGLDDGAAFHLPPRIAATLPPAELAGLSVALESIFDQLKDSRIPARERWNLCEAYGDVLDRLVDGLPAKLLHSGDAFGPATRAALATELAAAGVRELFLHAITLSKPIPPAGWRRRAAELWPMASADPVPADPVLADPVLAGQVLADPVWAGQGSAGPVGAGPAAAVLVLRRFADFGGHLHDDTDVLMRGLTWMLAGDPSRAATDLLCGVAVGAGTAPARSSGYPFAPKTAAAAVEILAGRPGDAPVKALARLALTVRHKGLLSRVQSALDRVGQERGWAPGEAAELAVESHGLDPAGRRTVSSEGRTALIAITGGKATLSIMEGTGPRPAFAEARALVKEINKTLAVERARVEALFAQEREWAATDWLERYLHHPVTATWSRQLIWQAVHTDGSVTTGVPSLRGGAWFLVGPAGEGAMLTDLSAGVGAGAGGLPAGEGAVSTNPAGGVVGGVDGLPGAEIDARAGTRIRLWHPAAAAADEVAAWRDHVVATGLRQPFKQAFREVYPLTPAEEATRVHSNRFAAHILRYRQANALMRTRGWMASYLGLWDGGHDSEATKDFAGGQWRAILTHKIAPGDDSDSGTVEYCATDQVRFARLQGRSWEQVALVEVPPRVFSEAMRDIDLFVAVTSVATDESWLDRGEDRFTEYWREATTSVVAGVGEIRRDALSRILPRLKISGRCELTGRFLRVRGTRATYKIHLGSANVLIEPTDTYLCIVAQRSGRPKVQLPFDDDPLLSTILSKAILLAADDRITDPTILEQLPPTPAPAMS